MDALGVRIYGEDHLTVVESSGALHVPASPLDCGNSGTSMRLLAGILAGQSFRSCLVGDESLSQRPMRRVTEPLARMGARIETRDGHAPLQIDGGDLSGIEYVLPVPSAQVKSAILLAGLFAHGRTTVIEPQAAGRSRNHTEIIMHSLGIDLLVEEPGDERDGAGWTVSLDGDRKSTRLNSSHA